MLVKRVLVIILWLGLEVIGFSPTILRHRETIALYSSASLDHTSKSTLSKEVIEAFENAANSVEKNDPKATNLELAARGQEFTSYRRNFDYLALHNSPSTWKRDNSHNANVKNLLMSSGVSEECAKEYDEGEIRQVYRGIGGGTFSIDTVMGTNVLDILLKNIAAEHEENICIKEKWTIGDVWITEAFLGEQAQPFLRVEKTLDFIPNVKNVGDHLVMTVKSYLSFDDGRETVSSTEVFVRTYNLEENGKGELLSTMPQRVPGCVANVDVRTVLIPSENGSSHRVMIDGMADAILSRGLVSLLQSTLSVLHANDVLCIEPSTVTDKLRLRRVLTAGRNDGLASVLTIVQGQIKSLLDIPIDERNVEKTALSESNNEVKMKPTVAMLLSGGVDSSVALNMLVRQGYDVTAFYLKIWLEDELAHLGQCPWEDDYRVCTEVCEQAGVPLEAISLQEEYKEKVLSYTINEAKSGRTPNPDIMCNSRVKFGCFYDAISTRKFDYVATGHYAQLVTKETSDGIMKRLLRAPDPVKDQSYFLAALTQEQLNKVLFPIGHLEKAEVRELAKEFDLPNKSRPDSQGLCFLGKVRFDDFLANYLGKDPGDIIDAATQEVIGKHNGIWFHTVGQRKGIGKVLDPKATSRGPWYVVAKDTTKKFIIASNQYEEEKFDNTRREFFVEDIRWITDEPPIDYSSEAHLSMKIRHGPTIVTGKIQLHNDSDSTVGKVILDEKDGGLAPGQFVAFYDDLECLGSAVISERHWLHFLETNDR